MVAHSVSAEEMFEQCQYKYHEIRVLKKAPYVQTEEAKFGEQQHSLLENALINDTPLGGEIGEALEFFRGFTGLKLGEQKLAINQQLKPVTYFANDVWYRAVIDVLILNGSHAVVGDYKTGKRRVEWEKRHEPDARPSEKQMMRYALFIMLHLPEIQTVEGYLYWTHNGSPPDKYVYHRRDDAERLLKSIRATPGRIDKKIAKGDRATWEKNESPLCGWCDVTECEYWRTRE